MGVGPPSDGVVGLDDGDHVALRHGDFAGAENVGLPARLHERREPVQILAHRALAVADLAREVHNTTAEVAVATAGAPTAGSAGRGDAALVHFAGVVVPVVVPVVVVGLRRGH